MRVQSAVAAAGSDVCSARARSMSALIAGSQNWACWYVVAGSGCRIASHESSGGDHGRRQREDALPGAEADLRAVAGIPRPLVILLSTRALAEEVPRVQRGAVSDPAQRADDRPARRDEIRMIAGGEERDLRSRGVGALDEPAGTIDVGTAAAALRVAGAAANGQ